MPSYKLTYFNLRGRGELIRQLFAQAGVKFEDNRVAFSDWPALKPKTPLGSLPLLEIDGKVTIPQSLAIARVVARETGQYGKNAVEAGMIDAVCYSINDIFEKLVVFRFAASDADKAAAKTKLDEVLQKISKSLETLLSENKGGAGFFVGDKPTMADIHAHVFYEDAVAYDPKALDATPKIKALVARVAALPNIKAWLAKRPKTDL